MPTGNTTLLGLALPVEGELSGEWGDVVNNSITSLVDSAIAGTTTLSTDDNVELTSSNLVANQARQAILLCTGARTGLKTVTAPFRSKAYIVINATTGGFSVQVVGAGPTTGVTIVNGEKALIAWNGSDFVKIASSVADGVTSVGGTGTVNGITLSGTVTSTGNLTLGGALTGVNLASQVTGTLPVANGGTGITSFGAGVATFLGTPSSANLAAAVTDETGTGALVFASSPTLAGTPLAPTATLGTNTTQIATTAFVQSEIGAIPATVSSFSAGTTGFTPSTSTTGAVTLAGTLAATNGGTGLTSLGAGVATFLGTPSSANLASAVTDETGSGALVFATSPTLVTPVLGTPTSGNFSTGTFTWPTFNQNTTGTASNVTGIVAAVNGGTGQSSYAVGDLVYASTTTALSKLADVATGNALISGGVGVAPSYGKIGLTTHVSGTLPVANGGTGITSFGTDVATALGTNVGTAGSFVVNGGVLGTPSSGTLTSCLGLPISTGVSGLGTNVATFLGTPSSANLRAALTDETGTGVAVFGTSPAITTSLTTPSTTFALVNTTATTLNFGGAATTLNVGAATGTMTVGNTTLAAKAITASTTLGVTGAATIQGLTVGLGNSAVANNTALGLSALNSNTVTGAGNTAIGYTTLGNNTDGSGNTATGSQVLSSNSTGSFNSAYGFQALDANTTNSNSTAIGFYALRVSTGSNNLAVGSDSGSLITTGSNNVIIGSYTGSSAPISATGSNWIVLSDGAGNVRQAMDATSVQFLTGAVVVYAPEPASFSALATLTNANLQTQLIVTTGTSFTLTMPLGSDLDSLISWSGVNIGYDFSVINTASGTITMAGNTGVTIVGRTTVVSSISGRFRIRRTAASTYIVYRIG
jgi:hypothetical protein